MNEASSPRSTVFLSILITSLPIVLPSSVSVAPGSSSDPSTAVFEITTSVLNIASFIVTTAGLLPLAATTVSGVPFTSPFSIVNVISVVTS